jgi:hypothetical protein
VVERFVAADARGDLVDAAEVDADAGRRPDADDLVAEETTTETTRETRTRTVTMDADGNVLDEKETVETEAVGAAPRTTDTVPSAAETTAEPDDAAFDALTLTEGQIDVVVDLLRENHGVDVGADELRDLLARVRTRKKYRGVESKAWQETEKGKRRGEGRGSRRARRDPFARFARRRRRREKNAFAAREMFRERGLR